MSDSFYCYSWLAYVGFLGGTSDKNKKNKKTHLPMQET